MALDFPTSPTDGQVYENYYWDSSISVWRSAGSENGLSQRVTSLETRTTTLELPGRILQVVTGSTTTQVNLSTTTYTDTTLTATITPRYANSKILVTVHQQAYKGGSNAGNAFNGRIYRGATNIFQFANATLGTGTTVEFHGLISNAYLDSPATTSATTYKTQFANSVAANQIIAQNNSAPSTIVLMEVAV